MRWDGGPPAAGPAPGARTSDGVSRGLVVAAVVVLGAGIVWALGAPGLVYAWRQSMISDLGARTCREAAGRWICSPRHVGFNLAQLGAAALLAAAAVLARRAQVAWVSAAQMSAGAGLALLGVFPSDAEYALHMVGAVLALPVASALLLAGSIRATGGAPVRRWRVALAAVALGLNAVHLVPGTALRGVAESASVAALCLALVAEAWTRPGRHRAERVTRRGGGIPARPPATRRSAPGSGPSASRRGRTGHSPPR